MNMDGVCLAKVQIAQRRISANIHRTPVLRSHTLDKLSGREVYLKTESFQKTGSFKARGALNGVLSLKERKNTITGVVTHSSGNHGQAVAYACQVAQLPCTVVVPSNTSAVKVNAIKGYGAQVVFCEISPISRRETCAKIAEETGNSLIHPYDNYDVIAGQGTIALELLEEVPDLDAILVPISGGGLCSGIAVAAKGIKPSCKVFCVEPLGKELQPCLESGRRLWPNPPQFVKTIGDGIGTQQLGQFTFPIVSSLCEKKVFTVNDQEMVSAMRLLWERCKIVVEPSSSAALAAVLSQQMRALDGNIKKVGVILTGGNVDLDKLPWVHFG